MKGEIVMKKHSFILFIIAAVVLLGSCSLNTKKERVRSGDIVLENLTGYNTVTIYETPDKIPSGVKDLNTLGQYIGYSSLDDFEKDFFDEAVENIDKDGNKYFKKYSNKYMIIKGIRIKSSGYFKDYGQYKYTVNNEEYTETDTRSFTVTEIEITGIYKQIILDGSDEYKIGDKIILFEPLVFYESAEDMKKINISELYTCPLFDGEYVLYVKMRSEPIKVGTKHFGFDIINNVWSFSAFALDESKYYNEVNDYLRDDVLKKYN